MKFLKFLWDYKYIIVPVFLLIGVYFDFAHIFMKIETEYKGFSYGVELNFSALADLIINIFQGEK